MMSHTIPVNQIHRLAQNEKQGMGAAVVNVRLQGASREHAAVQQYVQ